MNITVNFECKTDYVKKDGTIPLSFRITINRKNNYLKLGRRIQENHYDEKLKRIKKGISGSTKISAFLTRQKAKVDDIIDELERTNQEITFNKIKELFNHDTGKTKAVSFHDYVEIQFKYEQNNTSISKGTLHTYKNELKKLRGYRPVLSVYEINKEFVEGYIKYIATELGHAKNTQYHAHIFLRKYTLRLFNQGMIKTYPYAHPDLKVGEPHLVEIEYLEPEEITLLHELYNSQSLLDIFEQRESKYAREKEYHLGLRLQKTLRHFLVACYCGLRHSDIKTLRKRNVKNGYIIKQMVKGRLDKHKTVRIPIRERLYSLLDLDGDSDFIFEPVPENGTTNVFLKRIMQEASIDKHITFHCARHTFAVTSLLFGLALETISDILGHAELKTTQRYAKIVDRIRDQEMDKWDTFIRNESDQQTIQNINCPICNNSVLEFQKGTILTESISLKCPTCDNQFTSNLTGQDYTNRSELEETTL